MNLFDLKEEDLDTYIDSSLNGDPNYQFMKNRAAIIKKYKSDLEIQKKNCLGAVKKISSAIDSIIAANIERAYQHCHDAAKELDKASRTLELLPSKFGETQKQDKHYVPSLEKEAIFKYMDDGIIHIILPELLPKRLKFDASTGRYENTDGQASFKGKFRNTFYLEYQKGKHRIYSDKVIVFTVNYFEPGTQMNDADNLDGKAFLDMISSLYLLDDNPQYCAIMSDCMEGEYTHTEAYVVPMEGFADFYNDFYFRKGVLRKKC